MFVPPLLTQFLRKELGNDALPVSELEAKARAKGLLREDQSITHLKAFKLPVNRSERIFYRRDVDPAKISLPWTRQTEEGRGLSPS